MISEVYDAFREANVSDERARKVAGAVAASDNRFAGLELRMQRLDGRVTLVQWQLILLIGGVASLIVKAFF